MEFFSNTHIRFNRYSPAAFAFSGLLILIGIVSLIIHGGPRLGIDFTGGTILQVRIDPAPTTGDLRGILEKGGLEGVQVQAFGANDEFLITFTGNEKTGADSTEKMKELLNNGFPKGSVEMRREESVGPKIGGELKNAAFNSVIGALLLIVLYITVRFVFRYGIAAILALVHDVMITLGAFSILNKEVSLSIIAAFLTIIGYSLNDTIVVFDRIRENMRLRRRESYADVIDRSINETLSRTVITSGTTMLVTLALFLVGGPVIHDFAFALSFGVFIGTYSSIFVASPILVKWHERRMGDPRRRQAL